MTDRIRFEESVIKVISELRSLEVSHFCIVLLSFFPNQKW